MTVMRDELAAPELKELTDVLGAEAALALSTCPGGWRSASHEELKGMGVPVDAVRALQRLVRHGYPALPRHRFTRPEDVAQVYGQRLGGLDREVIVAVALDGRNNLIAELELASGGHHGIALTPDCVFRPLIRSGAAAFILVHNHPSGDPTPSAEDIAMTRALSSLAAVVGIELLDHIVVGARGGGWASVFEHMGELDEERSARSAVSG